MSGLLRLVVSFTRPFSRSSETKEEGSLTDNGVGSSVCTLCTAQQRQAYQTGSRRCESQIGFPGENPADTTEDGQTFGRRRVGYLFPNCLSGGPALRRAKMEGAGAGALALIGERCGILKLSKTPNHGDPVTSFRGAALLVRSAKCR